MAKKGRPSKPYQARKTATDRFREPIRVKVTPRHEGNPDVVRRHTEFDNRRVASDKYRCRRTAKEEDE